MDGDHRTARTLATLTFAFALVGCAGGSGQSTTPTLATSTPAATATVPPSVPASLQPTILPTPAATPGRLGATWRAVPAVPTHMGDQSIAVTAGRPGWIALAVASDEAAPTTWTSADGFVWQQGPALSVPDGANGDMAAMTSFRTDVYGLGLGWFWPTDTDHEGPGAVVWRSRDNGAWAMIGSGALFDLGPCPEGCPSARSIAAGAAGVVVAGYRVKPAGSRFELETDFWSSTDGATWVRVAAPAQAGSPDKPAAEISVAAGGPGFVAVGSLCATGGVTCRSVTWTSTDGRTWTAPKDLPGGKGVRTNQVAISPLGAVALGSRCTEAGCELVAWRSGDGITWEKADLAGAYLEGSTELAAAGDAFLVVSTTDEGNCAVWTSTDGRHWASEAVLAGLDPARPIGQLLELVGGPRGVLAKALMGRPNGGDGFWISP